MAYDSKLLRQLLREAVEALRAAGWTKRALERRLRIGSGNIDKLFDGSARLTLEHLLELAAVLEVPASQLLALAFPAEEAAAPRNLRDWIARGDAGRLLTTRAELDELFRSALRDELDRRGLTPQPAGANGGAVPTR